jgi:hypothetical protein
MFYEGGSFHLRRKMLFMNDGSDEACAIFRDSFQVRITGQLAHHMFIAQHLSVVGGGRERNIHNSPGLAAFAIDVPGLSMKLQRKSIS